MTSLLDPDTEPTAARRAALRTRLVALLVTAAPTVTFLAVDTLSGRLIAAVVAAATVAASTFVWQLHRREPARTTLPGVLLVAACAGTAALTGEARGFFLVPTLIPFAVILVCLATIAVGRPLTGLALNRLAGGPTDWPRIPRLRRVYTISTLACVAINTVNAVVQVTFYRADDTAVLGIAHLATGPVFAVLVALTLVAARRSPATPSADR
jgi:hypothetical protein